MKQLFLLLITLIMFSGCRKYPDDSLLQLQTPEKRIEGTWDLEYLIIDNVDSTFAVKSQISYKPLQFTAGTEILGLKSNVGGLSGSYVFVNNNKDISVGFDLTINFNTIGPYGGQHLYGGIWEIKKLSDDQFWVETSFKNKFCWMHFNKI